MSEDFPPPPEAVELTPEEWDAVRRLRERANEPEWPDAQGPTQTAAVEEPQTPAEPQGTAEPLAPVEPPPPPAETAPPVQDRAPATSPTAELPTWGGAGSSDRKRTSTVPMGAPLAVLVVVAVVTVVMAALVGLKVSDRHTRDRASTAALSAATSGVSTVLSYNYRSLDHDFAAAEALLTPSFRKAYLATTAKAVQPLAAKYQAVSTAQVSAAGVISATSSRAVVLVFVSQQVTNTQLSAPRLDRSRIEVELVHTHGAWLINKLNPI